VAADDMHGNPSRKELAIFGLALLVFFGVLGLMALRRPGLLLPLAAALAIMFLFSFLLDRQHPRGLQALGLVLPVILGLAGGAIRLGLAGVAVSVVLGGAGAVAALMTWLWPAAGGKLYLAWAHATFPIAWTVTHVLLALVYYGVLTPIGLFIRLRGHDPLTRKFEKDLCSYWVPRKPDGDSARYFRQY
jgi:hypothetical protein